MTTQLTQTDRETARRICDDLDEMMSPHEYVATKRKLINAIAEALASLRAQLEAAQQERDSAWKRAIDAACTKLDSYEFRTYDKTSGGIIVRAVQDAAEAAKVSDGRPRSVAI